MEREMQMVLYDPSVNDSGETRPVPDPVAQPVPIGHPSAILARRVSPTISAFTVQCDRCFKWRLIPTEEIYEQIRECISERPFYCEMGREWRPELCCDDPADITQDGSSIWAIDKPNIARPPRGWRRLLRFRNEGSTKFADVFYVAPSGKRFRSMVEVERYLTENPRYLEEGVKLSQFSFQTPRPLQQNYVRKRPARATGDHGMPLMPESIHPAEGFEGVTIDYIQRISGARLSFRLSEIGVEDDEMILEIKGTSSQVREANRLIQVFGGGYGLGLGSFCAQPGSGSFSSFAGGFLYGG